MITMHATDFSSPADTNLMMSLLTQGRRPALLVHCRNRAADVVVDSMLSWCASPVHVVRLPGTLDLPLARTGTLVVADASRLTLPQQIELHDWLNAGRGGCPDCVDHVGAAPAAGRSGTLSGGSVLSPQRRDAGSQRYADVATSCSAPGWRPRGRPRPRRGTRTGLRAPPTGPQPPFLRPPDYGRRAAAPEGGASAASARRDRLLRSDEAPVRRSSPTGRAPSAH